MAKGNKEGYPRKKAKGHNPPVEDVILGSETIKDLSELNEYKNQFSEETPETENIGNSNIEKLATETEEIVEHIEQGQEKAIEEAINSEPKEQKMEEVLVPINIQKEEILNDTKSLLKKAGEEGSFEPVTKLLENMEKNQESRERLEEDKRKLEGSMSSKKQKLEDTRKKTEAIKAEISAEEPVALNSSAEESNKEVVVEPGLEKVVSDQDEQIDAIGDEINEETGENMENTEEVSEVELTPILNEEETQEALNPEHEERNDADLDKMTFKDAIKKGLKGNLKNSKEYIDSMLEDSFGFVKNFINKEKIKNNWENSSESVKNALTKSLDWWNKDNSERTAKEKVGKTLLSAGFIGAGVFVTALGSDTFLDTNLLTKNSTLVGKMTSRVLGAGFASALTTKFSGNIANAVDGFKSLSKPQKIAVLSALGVVGAGGFMYFAGAGALAATGVAIGARFGADKLYNKNIEGKKSNVKSKEEQIEEIKRQIEDEENNTNKTLDINALTQNLDGITKDIEKLNNELRKIKTFQSITRGAISIAGGLGTMAAVNASKLNWREILENENNKPEDIKTPTTEAPQEAQDSLKEKSTSLWERLKNFSFSKTKVESLNENINTEKEIIIGGNTTPPDSIKTASESFVDPQNEVVENKIDIPKEAIIDGKDRVGITYAFRDQLRANPGMAKDLKIDPEKLNDAKYVAKVTKDLAIKLGYMDSEGHEVRVSEDGKNKIAYVLKLDAECKPYVEETDVETGKIQEVHKEGDSFEGSDIEKKYEYFEDKKYSYQQTQTPSKGLTDDMYPKPIRNSLAHEMGDDSYSYLENTFGQDEEILAPVRIKSASNYTLENLEKSSEWENIKKMNLKEFLGRGKINTSPEQMEIVEFLRTQHVDALLKDRDLEQLILSKQRTLTVEQARELYNKVLNENYDIKPMPIIEGKDYSNTNIEEYIKKDKELQEMHEIANKFKYNVSKEDLQEIKSMNDKNINKLFPTRLNKDNWNQIKDQSVKSYFKSEVDNPLTDYLNNLRKITGLQPRGPWSNMRWLGKEQIDEYITRCLLEAKKTGLLTKALILENQNEYEGSEIIIKKTNDTTDDLYR